MVLKCTVSLDQYGNNAVFNRTLKAARFPHSRLERAGIARLWRTNEWLVANSPNVEIKNRKIPFAMLQNDSESLSLCVQL